MYLLAIRTPEFDEWELMPTTRGNGARIYYTFKDASELVEVDDQHEYMIIDLCTGTYWTYHTGYTGWIEHEGHA
jgi:hypothetical protein